MATAELYRNPIDSGSWGPGNSWELFLTSTLLNDARCTTVAGVPIFFDKNYPPQVVLVKNSSQNDASRQEKWELPGGHLELVKNDQLKKVWETPEQALIREAREEGGLQGPFEMGMFACRAVINERPTKKHPAGKTYNPFLWMIVKEPLLAPTDIPPPVVDAFTPWRLKELLINNEINHSEFLIIKHGLAAAMRYRRANSQAV